MREGEYAVHFSGFESSPEGTAPFCLVFASLKEAEAYATDEVARRPGLRCRIYDSHGLAGAPIREFRGKDFRDRNDISPLFRRWGGGVLFFGGLLLFCADWAVDFRWLWPSAVGSRMILPGAVLVVTEVFIQLYEHHRRKHPEGRKKSA